MLRWLLLSSVCLGVYSMPSLDASGGWYFVEGVFYSLLIAIAAVLSFRIKAPLWMVRVTKAVILIEVMAIIVTLCALVLYLAGDSFNQVYISWYHSIYKPSVYVLSVTEAVALLIIPIWATGNGIFSIIAGLAGRVGAYFWRCILGDDLYKLGLVWGQGAQK
jgi:hypothetical protein